MALTLKVPPPADRQLTESKWEVAETTLRTNPAQQSAEALLTPRHRYTLHRASDGSLTRTRTKSQEETNVDLASPSRARGVHPVLVGNSPDPDGSEL